MSTDDSSPRSKSARPAMLLAIAFLAFISIGLPDGVLGVAWPSIQESFHLPPSQLGWMLLMGTIGYLISSFSGGQAVARLGVGRVVSISSLLMVIALSAYACSPAWGVMVGFATIAGLGSGAIDTGLNTYAARHFTPRMVNWLHAFYGAGAMLGPLVMTAFIESHLSWRWGYASLSAALFAMALCFALTRRRWDEPPMATGETAVAAVPPIASPWHHAFRRPIVLAGALAFFMYVGLEVAAGQWTYSLFTIARGIDPVIAGPWISIYWGSLTIGRISFGVLAGIWPPRAILRIATTGVPLGALLIWHGGSSHALGAIGLAVMGFSLSPIFPLLISQTPLRVGADHAGHAVGFQIAAGAFGSAAIPALAGVLARRYGLEVIGPYLMIVSISLGVMILLLIRLTAGRPVEASGFEVVLRSDNR